MTPAPYLIRRCDWLREEPALALAAQAWPEAERAGRLAALAALARGGQADRFYLLALWQNSELAAAVAAQLLPGRSAQVWPPQLSPSADEKSSRASAELLLELARLTAAAGTHVLQALLSPEQAAEGEYFAQGGFQRAASLLFLTSLRREFPEAPPSARFTLEDYREEHAERLAALVNRTYTGTLDCPALDGRRQTSDVILGYREVGEFRPQLWKIVRAGDTDAGCLLVNLHAGGRHAELVYLGLAPEFRGRELGLALTRHAQWIARELGCEQLVLSVDAANWPALRMYAAAGFQQFAEREVWLRSLADFSTPNDCAT